ncbi:MAG: dienelactone hydrolase family protein [Candidatus Obscuribacterales bacterium]|nr:dienelactone hydrolase family protein [Candidatus Obscuribacterales bacterium]
MNFFRVANQPGDKRITRFCANGAAFLLAVLSMPALHFLQVPNFTATQARAQSVRQILSARAMERAGARARSTNGKSKSLHELNISGLKTAIWVPQSTPGPWPIVIFSHGLHGLNRQSDYISEALADAGYLVAAPNHDDALTSSNRFRNTEEKLARPDKWSESTYRKRGQDIARLIAALKDDPAWSSRIAWSKISLMGHSLGGYTVLALAGAWSSWKIPGPVAVVALSPYANPFVAKQTLGQISIPVMYQTGTTDFGVAPFLKAPQGAFKMTPSPAYLVDIKGANHFTWTNLNREPSKAYLIDHYIIAFLDRFVKGDPGSNPAVKLPGVNVVWHH